MAAPLRAALARYVEMRPPNPDGLIFHNDGKPIDPRDDSTDWHRALEVAGVRDVPLHSARHTTASLLFKLKVPEQTRIAIMGHSSAEVTRGYTHLESDEAVDAMERLGDLLAIEP